MTDTILIPGAKAVEARLTEEVDRLELMVNSLGACGLIIGEDCRIGWASSLARGLFGDCAGKQCHEVLGGFEPHCEECCARDALVPGRGRAVCELKHTNAAGVTNWWRCTTTPLPRSNGGPPDAMKVMFPITELKHKEDAVRESEERLRLVTEAALDAIIVMDRDGRVTSWNPAAERILGYPAGEIVGKDLHAVLAPERFHGAQQACFPGWQATGQGGAVGKVLELAAVRNDGAEIAIELSLASIRIAGEWNAIGILRDISARRQLELHLNQAQKVESIGRLAAGIAHEINTPIQYVNDNTHFMKASFRALQDVFAAYGRLRLASEEGRAAPQLLAEIDRIVAGSDLPYLCEEIPKAIAQSLEGVDRVTKIVRAMKEFSHPGDEAKVPADLNRAIENTVAIARNEWKYVAEVVLDLDPALPLVPCLPGEINQVLVNLLINAAQAIGEAHGAATERRGTIGISTREDGRNVEVRISDTGVGIPLEVRPKLFTPFFTTKPVGKGTGQGLALAYNAIVKRHGGTITFESRVGEGTTFIVRLPLVQAEER